jgi:hypothetical protein
MRNADLHGNKPISGWFWQTTKQIQKEGKQNKDQINIWIYY